jgi:hypothetical protein
VISKLRQLLRRVVPAPMPSEASPAIAFWQPSERWDEQLTAAGATADRWLDDRRRAARLYGDLDAAQLDRLQSKMPSGVAQTLAAADRVLAHEFDLLGSGPTIITDPDRPRRANGYQPIDWNVDPIAKLRFPTNFPHKAWNPSMRPGLADIKWPWEIGRCQHWVTLGQAFRFTGDEKYAREIVLEHADFLEVNATGVGVQFVCTMDVAIRAFNWALAFEMIRASSSFDRAAMTSAYRSLFEVGLFIEQNLENTYEVTSNHFLSNIVGLYAVGVVFKDLAAGQRWIGKCREWVEQEMRVQILDDGVDYESSIPYHRLVAELFMGAARLAVIEGQPLSEFYRNRLRQMIDFHHAVTRPDGLMPQVGDADDGRLHIFTEYGTWRPQDGRHLLGPAAVMFDEPAWLATGGDAAMWEAAWWSLDTDRVANVPPPATSARLFADAGLAVSRNGGAYLLATNGRVGTNGFGNHKHNDLLSFEFHAGGVPLVVDPGSYLYTSNPDARNWFRSTRSHNTLQIDGVEQNDIRLDYLFRMFETSTVEQISFTDTPEDTVYRGRHTGYERLPAPVTHERELRLLKRAQSLAITDRLSGSGSHELKWHFHIAPGVTIAPQGDGKFRMTAGGHSWILRGPQNANAVISDAWYSPSFGVRVPCSAIDFSIQQEIDASAEYQFMIGPLSDA